MGSAIRAAITVLALTQPNTIDVPFPRPLPAATLVDTRRVGEPLELKPATADSEAVLAGQSYVQFTYELQSANAASFVAWYRDALFAAGWKLIDVSKIEEPPVQAGVANVAAHLRSEGRNVYARVTQQPSGRYQVNIADVGAENWSGQLARECRVRIHSVHFEHDRPIVQELESEPTLRKLAELIKSKTTPAVRIEGHMDNIGEDGRVEREQLSLGRARMVVDWLTKRGDVPANKVSAHGLGRSRPIADNDTDLGRALNRRIEVTRAGCTPPPGSSPPFIGYTREATAREAVLEKRFQDLISAQSISSLHRPLTERPHPAGSEATAALVKHLQSTLAGFGLDVKVHEYQALLSQPRSIRVTQIAPARREIRLTEPAIAEDPTSTHRELGGGYIAYSASGTATGDVVFVNYGLPGDYEALQTQGVSVKDRIALARYGRSHRAVKVHLAQQAGARAVILYSDPEDDGPPKGRAWPDGYWRGGDMLQRGNAKMSWFWHGDPLTPGVAAKPAIDRLEPMAAPTLPRIPVVVISANEAVELRKSIAGAGPGPARVTVDVDMDQRLRPIYDVVASLTGREHPDRRIMLGTHHDAWTFGGVDPGTGVAALLEVAKAMGALAKDGWRPSRTIDFAFWDAEEFGLIGSTEYAEEFRPTLQEQLIAYINIDMYMNGRFDPGGAPSLRDFVGEVVRDVPGKNGSVFDTWNRNWKSLGSGADFVPFQDHLGVPSLSIEFIGENGYGFGTYHSNFDSRAYVEKVADPGFAQGVVMARVLGTLALRLSNAAILPFRFEDYAALLTPALAEKGASANQVKEIASLAEQLSAAVDQRLATGDAGNVASLNDRLARLEQTLADDEGFPDTRWYRHVFYGWNIYSLYDGQLLPGLAEAVRVGDQARVAHENQRIARALDRMAAELRSALAELKRSTGR